MGHRWTWPQLIAVAVLVAGSGCKVNGVAAYEQNRGGGDDDDRPNVLIVLTDDQDVVLDGMAPMKQVQQLVANQGITFTNAFTSSPICCPSRASLLSGQYAHNHHTHNNSVSGGCDSKYWREHVEPHAFPALLHQNGYNTFYAGKYLNQYKSSIVPPGWSQWYGLNGNSKYHNFTLTENGELRKYGSEYLTDVLRDHALNFLRNQSTSEPFLAVIAPPAAHAPFVPAERHRGRFSDVQLLQGPNFNVASGELDKHWLFRMQPSTLSAENIETLRTINIRRFQTLLAVDEMVADIIVELQRQKRLANTYVVFTSDNGFHMGQFAQGADKRQPYETDIRVPLLVRGPNVRRKSVVDAPVALIDLMPTILDWTGIAKPAHLDGRSFASILSDHPDAESTSTMQERQILVEHWGEGSPDTYNPACEYAPSDNLAGCQRQFSCHCQDVHNNTYVCMREFNRYDDFLYCEFADQEQFAEAYDLTVDPFQLDNVAYSMLPSERSRYSFALENLSKCAGDSCRNRY